MWIVEVALRRPYTFLVMALLILLATPLVLLKMPTDIFPDINIPVISIVWNYSGLSAQEVGLRITAVNERSLTTTVNDIEHIESQSLNGIAVIKVFFQPNANIPTALAQVVALEQSVLRQLPTGILPPLVIKYSASSIPVIQLGLSSPTMTEQALFDTGVNFLRPRLVTVPGVAVPYPFGGKQRVISVDLDTNALLAKGLTPTDVVNAVNTQNLVLPSGTAKIGATEYVLATNGSPDTVEGLNRIPVATRSGATTYLSEVAHVRDGFSPQTNIVRQNGRRDYLDGRQSDAGRDGTAWRGLHSGPAGNGRLLGKAGGNGIRPGRGSFSLRRHRNNGFRRLYLHCRPDQRHRHRIRVQDLSAQGRGGNLSPSGRGGMRGRRRPRPLSG